MKVKLDYPDEYIIEQIAINYEIICDKLEFLPVGESSWLYVIFISESPEFVLKIQKELDEKAENIQVFLSNQDKPWLPRTIKTISKQPYFKNKEYFFSVQKYVESISLNSANSDPDNEYLHKLGVILKDLHATEPSKQLSKSLPKEIFVSQFNENAKDAINTFKSWSQTNPKSSDIADAMNNNKDNIDQLFINSQTLGQKLADQNVKLVLTHGDVHFGNIIESKDNNLYLIDWDYTMLAGPAHDLMYFNDDQLTEISKSYGKDLLENHNEIMYYRNHLMLRALWFWTTKAMSCSDQDYKYTSDTFLDIFNGSPYMQRALG